MMLLVPDSTTLLRGADLLARREAHAFATAHVLTSVVEDIEHLKHLANLSLTDLASLQGEGVGGVTKFIIDGVMGGATRFIADVERASAHFTQYARAIEATQGDAREVLRRCDRVLEEIRNAWQEAHRVAAILGPDVFVPGHWRDPPPTMLPLATNITDLVNPSREFAKLSWLNLAERWQIAVSEVDAIQTLWEQLLDDRRRAERILGASLDGSMLLGTFLVGETGKGSRHLLTHAITGLPVHPRHHESHSDLARLISGESSPRETARLWRDSEYSSLTDAELRLLPAATLIGLSSANGVPARVQNIAARQTLQYAAEHPGEVYRTMGFAGSRVSLPEFTDSIEHLASALNDAETLVGLRGDRTPVQLLGLGNHDDALTAAITVGDLDTASHVGVNVSGMFSTTDNMGTTFPGAVNLVNEARRVNDDASYAVLHWIGYRAPGVLPGEAGVLGSRRAESGGFRLSEFIDGTHEMRAAAGADPFEHFAVFGHSYGSTTAVEALKGVTHEVNHLVTYGSAGVDLNDVAELNVQRVSVTSALGDQVAWAGIAGSGRTNPLDIMGTTPFSSDRVDDLLPVTVHTMYVPEGESSIINPIKTAYLSRGTNSVVHMGLVLAGEEVEQ